MTPRPANLPFEAGGRVLVADLGLARALGEGSGLTSTGRVLGTPAFLSPEQARSGTATPCSDVYSGRRSSRPRRSMS